MSTDPVPSFDAFGPDEGRVAFILHGILGSRQNWRGFARRLSARLPGWRILTVDHRNHGDFPETRPPHTVAACAGDLVRLSKHLGQEPQVVVGHSFGGKVALVYARDHGAALEQAWVLDAVPAASPAGEADEGEVARVLQALRQVPVPLEKREDVVEILSEMGFSMELSRWMTTNLSPGPGGYIWRFDIDAAQQMIEDYLALDLWSVVEQPRVSPAIHLVRAERSDRWTPAILSRLGALPAGAPTRLHLLPDAGHWLHADNPGGLLELLLAEWPA